MEPREVCKICYNSTSHKPTPTLTYEPKEPSDSDSESDEKICSVCHQKWAPIRVAKELGSSRWVRIRPRPKLQLYIDFMMCKNLKNRHDCPKGQECSYAHSQAELWAWNQERQKEPRPAPHINGSYQYQLCKYISKSGNCPYGSKCTFAHTEEELQSWLKVQGEVGVGGAVSASQPPRASTGNYTPGIYKCIVCQLKCNSKKQLEDHINNSRHRQYFTGSSGYSRQQTGTTSSKQYTQPGNGQTRPRPTLSFHITGFRLCVHIQNGRRCLYGDYCTFAHSQAELDEWNQQGQRNRFQPPKATGSSASSVVSGSSVVSVSSGNSGSVTPSSELSVERASQASNGTKLDFSSSIRAEVAKEHKDTVVGLEATKEGVTVHEVTNTQLALTTSSTSPISWVFEVTTMVPHTLQSVVLFDPLNNDFDITYLLKHNNGSWEKFPVQGTAEQGVGMLLCYKMAATDKVQVKVTAKPRPGLLGQLIIFQFGAFHILQCMVVRMLGENEEKLIKPRSFGMKRPPNVDLFWENNYSKIAMENCFMEETDRILPEYILPQQIEMLIEKGKYSNVENRVTKSNYKRRMHNLLYLEEYQQILDLSRYDLYDVEVKVKTQYSTAMGVNFAPKGFHFISLAIDELLFEGGQSIRQGYSALLLPGNQEVIHECVVEHVGREDVVLRISEKAKLASASSRFRVSVRFILGRLDMRGMHYAVDQLDLDVLFPEVNTTPNNSIPSSPDVQKCLDVVKDSVLNPFQLQAIASMIDPSCLKIPSLVLGPFGCGKTRTLCECIELLALHMPNSCMLVCTHSNSAADIYVESLDIKWNRLDDQPPSMFRLIYTGRKLNTVSQNVRKYCRIQDGRLSVPSLSDMLSYKIVVSTLSTARTLALMEVPKGHFTHILIDEAAQALESETLIPLSLANSRTKIVLAGDHMQLDPPVYSDIARKYGLHVSLLERLYDLEAYESGVGQLCKTLLTENHRSHHLILDLPSQLFYKNKLSCKAKFPSTGPEQGPVDLPAVKFVCVEGQEEQDEDSPSYYNAHEATKVAEEAKLLADGGLKPQDICVLAYYSKQVQRIRTVLRLNRLNQVQVHRVDNVQGKEFRALIISTVRTSSTDSSSDREAGFLTNPKLFNTAVTRARQWLIVVGEPVTLCTVGSNRLCWLEYIRRCIGLKSFNHLHPSQFIGSLDYKTVTRQLLERMHQGFFKSVIFQKHPRAKSVSSPTSEQPTSEHYSQAKGFSVLQHQYPEASQQIREHHQQVQYPEGSQQINQQVQYPEGSQQIRERHQQVQYPEGSQQIREGRHQQVQYPEGSQQIREGRHKQLQYPEGSQQGREGGHQQVQYPEGSHQGREGLHVQKPNRGGGHRQVRVNSGGGGVSIATAAVAHSPTAQEHAAGDPDNKAFSHFAPRSKVQDVQTLVKGYGELVSNRSSMNSSISPKISPAPPKLSPAPLSNHIPLLTSSPNRSSDHSSSSEGPEVVNHSSAAAAVTDVGTFPHSDLLPLDDLPLFLRNMVDSLNGYSEWCEQMLAASYPLKISSKINDNLQRQRRVLDSQMKFLLEQIQLYRDYKKLRSSPKSVGQADVSSTQQFHFPTALPSSHPLSSGLNSAFTYDVGDSYFAQDSSAIERSALSQNLMKDKQLQLKGSGPSL